MAKKRKTNKKTANTLPSVIAPFDEKKSQVRQAARILADAEEIRANKAFMKQVRAEQEIQQQALTRSMKS